MRNQAKMQLSHLQKRNTKHLKINYFDTLGEAGNVHTQHLQYRLTLHQMMLDVATDLIHLPSGKLDRGIWGALENLGQFLEVDRVSVVMYDFTNNECQTKHEWHYPGTPSGINRSTPILIDAILEMVSSHFQGEYHLIYDVNSMPGGMARDFLLAQSIKSLMTIPLMSQSECVGFVALDSIHEKREYSELEIEMLQLFADMLINIMNRTDSEKRLQKLLHMTNLRNQRFRDFSYITSHNIRSSAVNLVLIADYLEHYPNDAKYTELLKSTVEKLNKSILNANNLLNFESTVETDETEFCDVADSIKRILKWHNPAIAKHNIDVVCQIPAGFAVKAYSTYLDSILNHALANAIRHGISDKSTKIKIEAKEERGQQIIKIIDYGKGIDLTRFSDKLFKLGARFHTENCDTLGMGLFIVKYQMEAMGGKVELQSQVDKGTTIQLTFAT